MKRFRNKKYQYGFTLVETLVALSILMLGLSAAFSVAQVGLQASAFAKDRITAFFLSQEAFEAVKNKRNHNLLMTYGGASTFWLEDITQIGGSAGPCQNGNPCDYDLIYSLNSVDTFRSCAGDPMANGCVLQYTPALGTTIYGYGVDLSGNSYPSSKFKREIIINTISSDEASVTVRIRWNTGSMPHTFEETTNIYNFF